MPKKFQQEWRVPGDFPTIQAAIEAAHEGDMILVAPGIYQEHLVIAKSLTLQGAGPNTIWKASQASLNSLWKSLSSHVVSGL